jgi:aspartate racemase
VMKSIFAEYNLEGLICLIFCKAGITLRFLIFMKKIGIVGGISWVSTLDYYKLINEGINQRLGGLNSAECIIYSLNFGDLQKYTWEKAYPLLYKACESLKKSGVDAIVLAANTAHLYADRLEEEMQLPFINIISETAHCILKQGLKTVGLLGTIFTMEMEFYRKKMGSFGLEVLTPESQETRNYLQTVIKDELGKGVVVAESRENFIRIALELVNKGAEGLILGCTEIPLLIEQKDFKIPVFDSTKIHSEAIIKYMID